jgi:hypothetical protein
VSGAEGKNCKPVAGEMRGHEHSYVRIKPDAAKLITGHKRWLAVAGLPLDALGVYLPAVADNCPASSG